jgi:hypothetical protein
MCVLSGAPTFACRPEGLGAVEEGWVVVHRSSGRDRRL